MLKQEVNTEIWKTRIAWKEKIHIQARSDKNKQTVSNVKKILIQRKFTKQNKTSRFYVKYSGYQGDNALISRDSESLWQSNKRKQTIKIDQAI